MTPLPVPSGDKLFNCLHLLRAGHVFLWPTLTGVRSVSSLIVFLAPMAAEKAVRTDKNHEM